MFAGIARQAELVRAGEVSARELVEASLDRIDRLDDELNAFRVVLADEALAAADAVDAARRDGGGAGDGRPLLGVPVAVKDDVAVAGQRTTFGTDAVTAVAAEDAEVVRRLRAAGAIVVGITNVPELAILPVTETNCNGATRNPWDLRRTAGGSSGGTAAAVAAGMVGAGLGS